MNAQSVQKGAVLVVDDTPTNLEIIVEYLIEADHEIFVATSGEEAIEQLNGIKPDLILLDVMLPGLDGFETCQRIKKNESIKNIPIIFMTALSDLANKVKGFDAGGIDYITKPFQREEILARVNTHLTLRKTQKALHNSNKNLEQRVIERTTQLHHALEKVEQLKNQLQAENAYLQEEIKAEYNCDEIIGKSKSLQHVLQDVQEVGPADTTVLILGGSGTGKELIARAVHSASHRKQKAFIKVNCAAIPVNLVESEFFGHEKGAFTGAFAKRDGRFTLADGGTLFLDEIGELPMDLQPKLLRILQEKEFEPVGSSQTKKVDVRVIAATNRDLQQAAKAGEFREDLYYRLSVFPIEVPSLKTRGKDIILLASFFANQFARKMGKNIAPITENMARRLLAYDWPGNIRELQNVIERAVITTRNGQLNLDRALPETAATDLPEIIADNKIKHERVHTVQELQLLERENILFALETAAWRIAGKNGAATLLGMKPSTLSSRIKTLKIQRV